MRAERLLRILLLLQAHGRLTARELARRLEVSTRTVQRDLDSLSLAGVPVYANRGRNGGWTLAADYRTRLSGLTPAEAMTVFVGGTARALADLGLDTAATSASAKLLATVPAHARRDAEYAIERILIDDADWSNAADRSAEWLGVLQQALWQGRKVRIGYASNPTEFTAGPLGLVAKKYAWYLVAAREDGELRTYRVSRVRAAAVLDEPYRRPAGFDLAEHWRRSNERYFASLRDYPVRLLVRRTVVHRLRWAANAVIESVTERPDGWSEVAMTMEKAYEARVYLLGLAGDIVVLDPPELRDAMTAAATALVEHHRPGATSA